MGMRWFLLVACIVCYVSQANCANNVGKQEVEADDAVALLGSLLGFKPCIGDGCSSYASSVPESESLVPETEVGYEYEPQHPESEDVYLVEKPIIHCIPLRPSAVGTFGDIESMHPGISDIKYKVLEDLVHHMYPFATLNLENCSPEMKLVDLIVLAGNTLKTQYVLQGGRNCTYTNPKDRVGDLDKLGNKTELPCTSESTKSDYVADGSKTPCPAVTKETEVTTQKINVTRKPCPEGATTEQPCEIAEKPTKTPCPEGVTTEREHPCEITEKPCPEVATTEQPCQVTKKPIEKPCPEGATTEQPCQKVTEKATEPLSTSTPTEILPEDESYVSPPFVGSIRGIPGVHYPNYTDVPITSFSCADKKYVPGFYADLDAGCQVFHVCYEHRRESFLCPVGTIFNQPILACDYWYSSNCSLAPLHYEVNEQTEILKGENIDYKVEEELSSIFAESETAEFWGTGNGEPSKPKGSDLDTIAPFFPVKAKVTDLEPVEGMKDLVKKPVAQDVEEIASEIFDKIVTTATKVASKTRDVVGSIPEPEIKAKPVLKQEKVKPEVIPMVVKPMKLEDLLAKSVVPLAKAKLSVIPATKVAAAKTKLAAAVIPASKVAAMKAVAPAVAKTKIVAAIPASKLATKTKIAIPVVAAKAKVAAAVPVAKVAAVKAAIPVVAAKAKVAAAVPVAKVAAVKAAVPVVAAKAKVAAAVPVAKVAAVKAVVPAVTKAKVAVPVAAKMSLPVLKTKMIASALPLAKAKIVAPALKGKMLKGAGAPLLKAKMLALPLAKSKLAGPLPLAKVKFVKAAAISPLTKKALALGYMKLLKAKKLALMG